MTPTNIAIRYAGFALLATLANLLAQELTVRAFTDALNVYLGIIVGTIAGLVSKYYLDKQFIFSYQPRSPKDDAQTFLAYTLTGIGTTLLFWTTEIGFELVYGTKTARYLGAIIGLTLGYVVKYQLDKRYVFLKR
ncbi:MAG: GtrA family protein [Pseudomonadales bacterium]|nr:GtrA family protein [Pseudomonadales bacterium]